MSESHVEFPRKVNNAPPKREWGPSNVLPMLSLEVVVWQLLKVDWWSCGFQELELQHSTEQGLKRRSSVIASYWISELRIDLPLT
ncbi:hypothetical protein SLA2020_052920 [Shorea laevis]